MASLGPLIPHFKGVSLPNGNVSSSFLVPFLSQVLMVLTKRHVGSGNEIERLVGTASMRSMTFLHDRCSNEPFSTYCVYCVFYKLILRILRILQFVILEYCVYRVFYKLTSANIAYIAYIALRCVALRILQQAESNFSFG